MTATTLYDERICRALDRLGEVLGDTEQVVAAAADALEDLARRRRDDFDDAMRQAHRDDDMVTAERMVPGRLYRVAGETVEFVRHTPDGIEVLAEGCAASSFYPVTEGEAFMPVWRNVYLTAAEEAEARGDDEYERERGGFF